jgi:hypothetical protein
VVVVIIALFVVLVAVVGKILVTFKLFSQTMHPLSNTFQAAISDCECIPLEV